MLLRKNLQSIGGLKAKLYTLYTPAIQILKRKTLIIIFFCFLLAGGQWYGVDITKEDIADNFQECVWEPSIIKINALTAASEAAIMILSVDETIKSPKSGDGPMAGAPMGRGMGRPM